MSSAIEQTVSQRRRYLALLGLIAVLAMAARASTIWVGLMSDDFMQHGMLAGLYPGEDYAPFDLYGFLRRGDVMVAHVEHGTAPWWAVPELHGTVLRPLASVLLWLDATLLPGRIELWHVHSLLWFGASIVALGLVTRRLLPSSIALIAVALFACEAGMVSPLSWLANRCVLIAATFGLLAIWVHIEWRNPDPATPTWVRKRGPLIEAALMTLCISAGEYGLGILAYLVAWELLAAPRPDGPTPSPRASAAVRALLPAMIPVIVYLIAHKLGGYGTFGAEVYADPFHTPSGYLHWANKRVPKLIAAGFWSIPAATIHAFRFGPLAPFEDRFVSPETAAEDYHATHVRVAWVLVAIAVVVAILAWRGLHAHERRSLRALVVGGLLGLLPIAVAPAHSRLLVIAQLGACSLVAAILVATTRLVTKLDLPDPSPARPRLRGVILVPFAGVLAFNHSVGDLRWGQAYIDHIDLLQAQNLAAFTHGDVLGPDLEGADVIIVNAPSQSLGLFGPFVLDVHGWPAPRSWRPLALGGQFALIANRPGPNSLELSTVQGAWMHTAGELFFRREDQPLDPGTKLHYPTLDVEILSAVDGHPTRVRFDFDRPLERFLFVIATPEGLERWRVPAIGKVGVVPLPRLPQLDDPDDVVFPRYQAPEKAD